MVLKDRNIQCAKTKVQLLQVMKHLLHIIILLQFIYQL